MHRRHLLGLGSAAAVLGLAGCTRPIYNVESRPFGTPGRLQQRALQIQRAAATLGWETEPVRPGLIRATLHLRTHVAVVDIAYDADRFSIRYVDSTNLQYDGTSIHKNYNGWIENLERAITLQPPG